METWDILQSPADTAARNMATDEVLLRTAVQRRRPLLRIYSWDRPSLSIGYFQKFPTELAAKFVIVRRVTGGGFVYHVDDTTFTVVAPPGHPLHKLKTNDAYCAIHKAVAASLTLKSEIASHKSILRGQYECFQNPVAGDVVAGSGEKLAGGAQRRNRDGMLHQGSIAARVADLPAGFRQQFDCDFKPYCLTGEEFAMITWLADGKYSAEAWNKRL